MAVAETAGADVAVNQINSLHFVIDIRAK